MDCPACGRFNSILDERCDCGHVLASGAVYRMSGRPPVVVGSCEVPSEPVEYDWLRSTAIGFALMIAALVALWVVGRVAHAFGGIL